MIELLEKPTDKQLTTNHKFIIQNVSYLDMKLLYECKEILQLRYNKRVSLSDVVERIFMKGLRSKEV